MICFIDASQPDLCFPQGIVKMYSVNPKICLILAHPDLSAYRVVLSWLWINDHIWNKEIA